MTVQLRHRKSNAMPDWTQAQLDYQISLGNYPSGTRLHDIVLPSDWNDDHDMDDLNNALDDLESLIMMNMGA